jgi:dTDP-4-dehydrorhamnose reductase
VRILVTGAGGGLGRAFLAAVPAHHDVVALTHGDLDVGSFDDVMRTLPFLRPELIVNCAAFTAVDANETDRMRAYRDNAAGPGHLGRAARRSGATLLHVSTDYVFDGTKGVPYDELDEPSPLSVYGRAKLVGERAVREATPDHVIVRVGYVFGGGGDYLTGAVRRLAAGEEAGGLVDRIGTPTFVEDIARRLLPIALAGRPGTVHLAGPEPTTWNDVLLRAASIAGLPGTVVPQTASSLGLPAPRPADSSLTSLVVEELSRSAMPPLDDALGRFLEGSL